MTERKASERAFDAADAPDEAGLVHRKDLLAQREARTLEPCFTEQNMGRQHRLMQVARERNCGNDGAELVGGIVGDDDNGTHTGLNAAANGRKICKPNFKLCHDRDHSFLSTMSLW